MQQASGQGEKNAEAAIEADREIEQIMQRWLLTVIFDLEAVESALRTATLSAGAKVLEGLLQGFGCGRREHPVECRCGTIMNSTE